MASNGERGTTRLPTHVDGLDNLLDGGLPDRRLTLLYGGTGVGKTVLALEIVVNNAMAGLPGVVVGFEESPEELIDNHASFNWQLADKVGDTIHLLGARVEDEFRDVGRFEISGLLASIEAKIRQTGARWVVIDGLDALLGTLGDRVVAMRELFRLKRWLTGCGVAVIITAKLDQPDNTGATHFRDMPYVADCVVTLRNTVHERTFRRTLRVVKIRGGQSSSAEVPFVITPSGVILARRENRRMDYQAITERLTTGVGRLDTLLDGGYVRGSSILISGAPGTAKTTLAATFAEAMAKRDERVLFISFDEAGPQIAANLQSVGIDLETQCAKGRLEIMGLMAGATSAEAHYIDIRRTIQRFDPQHIVIDPISALAKAGGNQLAADVTERLLDFSKSHGVTFVLTSLLMVKDRLSEATESHVSTIADLWINLTFNIAEGERNRALTVVKGRGIAHSNQVRELLLTRNGPDLADVYIASGTVLMGTARIQKEQEVEERRQQEIEAFEKRRGELEASIDQTAEQIATLNRQLEQQRSHLERLDQQEQNNTQRHGDYEERLLRSRGADANDRRFVGEEHDGWNGVD